MNPRISAMLVASLYLAPLAHADPPRPASPGAVAVGDLMRDLTRVSNSPSDATMVMWMPTAFWRAAGVGTADPLQVAATASLFEGNTIVAVVDGAIGPFGATSWTSEEEVRRTTRLVDALGARYAPLPEESISPDLRMLTQVMRPMLAANLGASGENFHLLVFPAKTGAGTLIADPLRDGTFAIDVGGERLEYRTPLESLFEARKCPVDGRALSGTYQYCPWHGNKL